MPRSIFALCFLLCAGCVSTRPAAPVADPAESARPRPAAQADRHATKQQVAQLLLQARQAQGADREAHRLTAAELLADSGELLQARELLNRIDATQLGGTEAGRYLLLRSELSVLLADGSDALESIARASPELLDGMPPAERLRLSRLRATALDLNGQHLAAAMERILTTASLAPAAEIGRNREAIWKSLMQIPAAELAERARTHPLPVPRGWLELATLTKQYQHDIDEQMRSLDEWLMRNPQHPAALDLPGDLKMLNRIASVRANNVYLMLPLSGRFAPGVGLPIRNGFLSAYYAAMENGRDVPEVHFVNTDGVADVGPLYQEIVGKGADFVIGPFRRELVSQLAALPSLPVPVLALNYIHEAGETPAQLFQYGLSAEDEARSAAERAWADGHRHALAIVPEGLWGDRVLQAFNTHLSGLGGKTLDSTRVGEAANVKTSLASLLQVNRSRDRALRVQQTIGQEVEYIARRRQDASAMFLATLPRDARMIKPSLNALLAHDLPIYATSHIYSGQPDPRQDSDLNGIQFCDVPWNLIEPDPAMTTIQDTWGTSVRASGRLYAMGIDAFSLFPRVFQMQGFPDSRFYGYTGALSVNRQRKVRRELMWATFNDGLPVAIRTAENETGRPTGNDATFR